MFLASMASRIVNHGQENNYSRDKIFATVLVWLALSSVLVGLALMLIGRLKLASLVQYLYVLPL